MSGNEKATSVQGEVRLWLYGGGFKWTCFDPLHPLLADAGIRIVQTPVEADVCVARYWRWKSLLKYRWQLGGKRFLIYNDEPNWPGATKKLLVRRLFLPDVHVMVPENGEIFRDVTNIFGWAWKRAPSQIHSGAKKYPARMLCMLARKGTITENSRRLKPDGYDLRGVRLHLAEEAQKRGMADVFGIGWPDSARTGESRGGDQGEWHEAKLPIMDEYGFAMAMENTLLENYVTEKIWDAIQCSSLPLYYGNDWIYSEFPRDSFLDVKAFSSAHNLLQFMAGVDADEVARRKGACAEVYARLHREGEHQRSEQRHLLRLADRLRAMCSARLPIR
jgi:hypothetical protein